MSRRTEPKPTAAFETGLIARRRGRGVPAVGVELTSTEPSQIPWYKGHNISSVDDLDQLAGQAALLYALAGSPRHLRRQADRRLAAAAHPTRQLDARRSRWMRARPPRAASFRDVHALPFAARRICCSAVALAPALLRALADGGHTRANYRDRELPFPFGVLDARRGAASRWSRCCCSQRLGSTRVFYPEVLPIAVYALGVVAARADRRHARGEPAAAPARRPPRGWRGHGAALLRGELSTAR